TPSPTGTLIGEPVFSTGDPRTMPSVGFRAIVRTIPSPMCWATSHVIDRVSPSRRTSIRSAVWISGSPSGGNSTSTTGPITRATRPCASSCSAIAHSFEARASAPPTISMISVVISSWRAAVCLPGEHRDELVRVVGRGRHRALTGGVLGGGGLEQREVDLRDDVLREQVVQELGGLGVADVVRAP